MNRFIFVFATILLLIFLFVPLQSAQQSRDSLVFSPDKVTKVKNEQFEVEIKLNTTTTVNGYDVTLRFDPSVIQVVRLIQNTTDFNFTFNEDFNNTQGNLRLAATNENIDKLVSGNNIVLGKIIFKGKARGQKKIVSFSRVRIPTFTTSGQLQNLDLTRGSLEVTITEPNAGTSTCNLCVSKALCLCSFVPF